MNNDLAILIALDSLRGGPVLASTIAECVPQFWRGKLPADLTAAVEAGLERLKDTGDVRMTPNRFTGAHWSLTTQGTDAARQ